MVLSPALARFALARPHVLLVGVPGWDLTRLAAEAELGRRGWPSAVTPAGADLLLVCGEPGDQLADAIESVWAQLPGPRARARPGVPRDVAGDLDEARDRLHDPELQRADARDRPAGPGTGAMDDMPAGLMMADRAEDRDGLKLDQLHLQLGPVLADWPGGLVLTTTLQGDVVQAASVEVWPGIGTTAGPAPDPLVRRLDTVARVLAVAGWADGAARARVLRDRALDDPTRVSPVALDTFARRVLRARALRWALGGPRLDIHARLAAWFDGSAAPGDLDRIPDLVTGLDLAAARLSVAALAPDTDAAVREAVRG